MIYGQVNINTIENFTMILPDQGICVQSLGHAGAPPAQGSCGPGHQHWYSLHESHFRASQKLPRKHT